MGKWFLELVGIPLGLGHKQKFFWLGHFSVKYMNVFEFSAKENKVTSNVMINNKGEF